MTVIFKSIKGKESKTGETSYIELSTKKEKDGKREGQWK